MVRNLVLNAMENAEREAMGLTECSKTHLGCYELA
jgi:hypothetical protein